MVNQQVRMYYGSGTVDRIANGQPRDACSSRRMQLVAGGRCMSTQRMAALCMATILNMTSYKKIKLHQLMHISEQSQQISFEMMEPWAFLKRLPQKEQQQKDV